MWHARQKADGTLYEITARESPLCDDDAPIDEIAPHAMGARLILDPDNPRRAIPAPVPPPTYAELREAGYERVGATERAMVVALWERIVEGRPAASDDLQAKRAKVKLDIPKPT